MIAVTVLVGCEACAREGGVPPALPQAGEAEPGDPEPAGPGTLPSTDEPDPPASSEGSAPPAALVARAELARMEPDACKALLREHDVAFEEIPAADAPGVRGPIRLSGPIGGITVAHSGRSERHEIMDCRLGVALLGWAPALRAAGFDRVEHASIYRPGARVRSTGQLSGHDGAVAIDAFFFIRPDGTRLEVERDWEDKTIGGAVCPPREGEPEAQHVLRTLVCDAIAADLFQVVVTPHGDRRHRNHVHLEIRPDVDWTHVR